MMQGPALAVCSWSLRPTSPEDLVEQVRAAGLRRVQLALRPFVERAWSVERTKAAFESGGLKIVSGMMEPFGEDYTSPATIKTTGGLRPDATWEQNQEIARRSTAAAVAFGIGLVTFHAGFLPEEAGPERTKLVGRIRRTAEIFASAGVRLGLETGQETADGLLHALAEIGRQDVGVNFDPANMILYGMGDPIDALRRLGGRVRQVHLKDARPAAQAGEWGVEVPAGSGVVDWDRFFSVLKDRAPGVAVVIEREAGDARVRDVRTAVELATRVAGARP